MKKIVLKPKDEKIRELFLIALAQSEEVCPDDFNLETLKCMEDSCYACWENALGIKSWQS